MLIDPVPVPTMLDRHVGRFRSIQARVDPEPRSGEPIVSRSDADHAAIDRVLRNVHLDREIGDDPQQ